MAMASAGLLPTAIWALATCGAEPALLKTFLKNPPPPLASALPDLRSPQLQATFHHGRFAREHLVKEGNCVIEVFPGERVVALGEERPQVARNFIHTFFWHGEAM